MSVLLTICTVIGAFVLVIAVLWVLFLPFGYVMELRDSRNYWEEQYERQCDYSRKLREEIRSMKEGRA